MAISKMTSRFATDENSEEGGVWVDFGDGIRVRIRRMRSKKSQEVRKELEKPYVAEIRRGPLPDVVSEELLMKQIAFAIISDWEGVDLGDGEPVPYTRDNALTVVKKFGEFRDAIIQVSVDAESYRVKVDEDAEKNSETTSPGA